MLLAQTDLINQKAEVEQSLQLELIQLKQKFNAEKVTVELEMRRMQSDKKTMCTDLENYSNEVGHKRKVLTEEIETLSERRNAEEKRLNAKKPDYEKLSAEAEGVIKSLELREKTLKEGLAMVHEITANLEKRELAVKELETFYKGIEGDSFITRLNKLKNK